MKRFVINAATGAAALIDINPAETAAPTPVPERATLSDWRVALVKMGRLQQVLSSVAAAKAAGNMDGVIAHERLEYANHVYRPELMQLAPLFGFTPAEVDESMRLAGGD